MNWLCWCFGSDHNPQKIVADTAEAAAEAYAAWYDEDRCCHGLANREDTLRVSVRSEDPIEVDVKCFATYHYEAI